jgi:hypothetical protein
MKVTTIGLDIAKRAFQVHGIEAAGQAVLRRKLGRGEVLDFFRALPPCLIGIEACCTAHHWAREIRAPDRGARTHHRPCVEGAVHTGLSAPSSWPADTVRRLPAAC